MKLDAADIAELQPIIRAAVRATLDELQASEAKLDGSRLAFTEAESAGLLGVPRYVLRDCRLRGELKGRLCGKKIVYSRDELVRFLGNGGPHRG